MSYQTKLKKIILKKFRLTKNQLTLINKNNL